ncbi:cytochrome P460 [Chitinophaga skermanii]|uniref:Cytochrome P460 n=1 Tax=Chitinophaga skermanii TaxID=331697 RepID=A0A327PZC1_9BACT|nr:heme-binding domain-containing protein [Chitinophaga skermanii]RAI97580.1 cytochrome P460 [Chitinophaga skermanii]
MKISNRIKIFSLFAGICTVGVVAMAFTTKVVDNPPVTGEVEAPVVVKNMLQRACYDCHSNKTDIKWFDKLPIAASIVRRDVVTARKHLNFTEWDKLSKGEQDSFLWEAYNMINAGNMPLPEYAALHSNAQVTKEELAAFRAYLETKRVKVTNTIDTVHTAAVTTTNYPIAPTGIQFSPEFRNWQVMSTTSRIDNTTMRVMYANPIAMKAIKEHKINPWPDGAIVVKVVWEKEVDSEGNMHPGKFLNVQYMVRNAKQYESTDGWGYAKFETPTLKPYGTLLTAQSCASCHKAANATGGIFDLPTSN